MSRQPRCCLSRCHGSPIQDSDTALSFLSFLFSAVPQCFGIIDGGILLALGLNCFRLVNVHIAHWWLPMQVFILQICYWVFFFENEFSERKQNKGKKTISSKHNNSCGSKRSRGSSRLVFGYTQFKYCPVTLYSISVSAELSQEISTGFPFGKDKWATRWYRGCCSAGLYQVGSLYPLWRGLHGYQALAWIYKVWQKILLLLF